MLKKVLAVVLLLSTVKSLLIPLNSGETRCMIIYTAGESDSAKVTMSLPILPYQIMKEYYEITVQDTETNEYIRQYRIHSGLYKRYLDLRSNVIYEVCVHIISAREFKAVEIDYSSENVYNVNQAQVKVPDSLLKRADLIGTYEMTYRLYEVGRLFLELQHERSYHAQQDYEKTMQANYRVIIISVIEILLVLLATVVQFIFLRRFLLKNKYM